MIGGIVVVVSGVGIIGRLECPAVDSTDDDDAADDDLASV